MKSSLDGALRCGALAVLRSESANVGKEGAAACRRRFSWEHLTKADADQSPVCSVVRFSPGVTKSKGEV